MKRAETKITLSLRPEYLFEVNLESFISLGSGGGHCRRSNHGGVKGMVD